MPTRNNTEIAFTNDGGFELNIGNIGEIEWSQDTAAITCANNNVVSHLNSGGEISFTLDDAEYMNAMRHLINFTGTPFSQETTTVVDSIEDTYRRMMEERDYILGNSWVLPPNICAGIEIDEEPELDEENETLNGFLKEFVKEAV